MSKRAGMMQAMRNSDDISATNASGAGDETFHRELEAFLAHSAEATTWHVEQVIKQSEFETTELVQGRPKGGPVGRYVRKVIDVASGAGAAYEELWRAQKRGVCLACAPRLIECTRSGCTLTVVMEHVDGCTVDALQRAIGAGEPLAALVLPALSRAVTELHTALPSPLIHRDLKPSNVIMRDGEAIVIDFGSARIWHPDASSDTTHFLTRCYAPPEQFGFGQTDERTDVYALGKILYFCLTGEQPPNVCGASECIEGGIRDEWAQVIETACAFDPAARYAAAVEFESAVESVFKRSLADSTWHAGAKSDPFEQRAAPSVGERIAHGVRGPGVPEFDCTRDAGSVLYGRATVRNPLARIPAWVGRAWNVLLLAFLVAMIWMSVETLFNPLPRDMGRPIGYLFVQNIICIDSMLIIGSYLMLDRRRIRMRYPVLARWGILRETVYGIITIMVIMFGGALITVVMGWS